MLSNNKAITESWMIHLKAAEIKELEIPRRYIEDSTASKTTNERAKATLDQVRSGCSVPDVLSMPNDSYTRQSKKGRWFRGVARRGRVLWRSSVGAGQPGRSVCRLGSKNASGTLDRTIRILPRSSCDITSCLTWGLNSLVPKTWDRNSLSADQGTRAKITVISSRVYTDYKESMDRMDKMCVGWDAINCGRRWRIARSV